MNDSYESREHGEELYQLISFVVGREEYGLEILRVREVTRTPEITRLPKTSSYIRGIINLRGDVIPIVDLRDKFGLEAVGDTDETRIIVIEIEGRLVGIVVDGANQVVRVSAGQIEPPPPMLGGLPRAYMRGVAKLDGRLIVMLDIDNVLSNTEKRELERLSAAAHTEPPASVALDRSAR